MHNFSPSINIVRDVDKQLNYITTVNAQNVFNQLINDYKTGIHSFNIIGSYGTGKSTFLLALAKTLKGEEPYFGQLNGQFNGIKQFNFVNIIGSYSSLIKVLAEKLGITGKISVKKILQALTEHHQQINTDKQQILFIIIDEFGKHLEYAAKNSPEKELYFIQQLAEFVNDENNNIILLTTLHQNFTTYARDLSQQQQNEWVKVQGRLKELTFNEPVEQLLLLAAKQIPANVKSNQKPKNLKALYNTLEKANVIPLNSHISMDVIQQLFPFDLLAASVLALALQNYGQNKRSLFTFLNSNDAYSLKNYDTTTNPYYNLSCVYDYLAHNYYSYITTKHNPHYAQWRAIQISIERVEGSLPKEFMSAAIKLIKTIGLLNIFASDAAKLDISFFKKYGKYSLGLEDVDIIVKLLESKKIIRYKEYKNQYVLFEGTDIDIEAELLRAASKIDKIIHVSTRLKRYFNLPYLPAKAVQYHKGTPRFFAFELSEKPINKQPKDQIDGYINLIFSEKLNFDKILQETQTIEDALLYAYFKNVGDIKQTLFEIAKIDFLLEKQEIQDDKIAYQELRNLRAHEISQLNDFVLNKLFDNQYVQWIYKGASITIDSQTKLNKYLSVVCNDVYSATPTFRNELMNRHHISGAVSSARKKFFKRLLQNWNKENIGFDDNLFPAEKAIYLSLLKRTGIHQQETAISYTLGAPTDVSFQQLWNISEQFLESAKINRRKLTEFKTILLNKPLKLKKVVVDFWIPTYLFIKRNDYALFKKNIYIPNLTADELEVIYWSLDEFQIKTFNVAGVRLDLFNKYRELLNQTTTENPIEKDFIGLIKPFLTFYKELPVYTQQTTRLQDHTIRFREAIKKAKDPETTFFEDFPKALKFHNINKLKEDETALNVYIDQIQDAIRELRTAYDEFLNRVEVYFLKDIGYIGKDFKTYKRELAKRYQHIKKHLLLSHQKMFFSRITAPLEDRAAWWNSLASVLLRKGLDQVSNEKEESVLYEKLSTTFRELDNLCELHQVDFDEEKEEILKFDITSLDKGTQSHQLRLSKQKNKEVNALEQEIKAVLGKDRVVNQAVLVRVLKSIVNDGSEINIDEAMKMVIEKGALI